ncbi:MAG TPA: DUF5318 family protein [Actinopolymorphaceae bacterium]
MWSQRSVVDYSLQRRATLRALLTGRASVMEDVCDADPYLLRAAKFHGEQTTERCPICRRDNLTHVTYVFGDELGQYSGRIRRTAELEPLARRHGELRVFVVEVCQRCHWNHLTTSYVVGDGVPRTPPRRQRTVEDDYP